MNNLSRISSACYITLNNPMPGIVGLLIHDEQTGAILSQLAEHLLKGTHTLPVEFRELIAAHVSKTNNCNFCYNSHKQIALASCEGSQTLIEEVLSGNFENLSPKHFYLLKIAENLAKDVQGVTPELVQTAKEFEATDEEILRTVQIAAAFCLYNRYVDGMGTIPGTKEYYEEAGKTIAESGYMAKKALEV